MKTTYLDLLAAIFVLAIVYVLVRPRSAGRAFITAVTGALTAMVKAATDIATPQ